MVLSRPVRVHAEGSISPGRPAFPQIRRKAVSSLFLQLRDELGPYRDHPHEQRNRRQRSRLFNKKLQHARLPANLEHRENNVPFMFLGVKPGLWVGLKCDPERFGLVKKSLFPISNGLR